MGQSIGPVFGGLITQYFGFRAIFWFLFILGATSLGTIVLLLPETLRSVAGNGTVRLTGFQRPLIYSFKPQPDALMEPDDVPKRKVTLMSVLAPLRFLFEKDVFVSLFFGSIVYTGMWQSPFLLVRVINLFLVWSMVTSSTTALFQARFSLTDLQVGLVFLPNGLGCILGSTLTGYLMDYDYKRTETEYRREKGIADDLKLSKKTLIDFPIERSRLRSIWWIVLIFIVTTALYGFSLSLNQITLSLFLQFFIAYTATAVFSFNSALVIDLYPGASASATAVNNLMRCSVGAVGIAVIQLIIDSIGAGFAFLALALLTAALSPLLLLEWFYGESWRRARTERLAAKEAKKKEVEVEKV